MSHFLGQILICVYTIGQHDYILISCTILCGSFFQLSSTNYCIIITIIIIIIIINISNCSTNSCKSKVNDRSPRRTTGSLFDSYYT